MAKYSKAVAALLAAAAVLIGGNIITGDGVTVVHAVEAALIAAGVYAAPANKAPQG